MVEVVERFLDPSAGSGQALHKQLPKAKTPHEQESLKRTIDATGNHLGSLVYGEVRDSHPFECSALSRASDLPAREFHTRTEPSLPARQTRDVR